MALGPSRREEVSEPGTLRRPRFDGRSPARFDEAQLRRPWREIKNKKQTRSREHAIKDNFSFQSPFFFVVGGRGASRTGPAAPALVSLVSRTGRSRLRQPAVTNARVESPATAHIALARSSNRLAARCRSPLAKAAAKVCTASKEKPSVGGITKRSLRRAPAKTTIANSHSWADAPRRLPLLPLPPLPPLPPLLPPSLPRPSCVRRRACILSWESANSSHSRSVAFA